MSDPEKIFTDYVAQKKTELAAKSAKTYRLQCKNYFLTYNMADNEDVTKEDVMEQLKIIFEDPYYMIVCKEKYKVREAHHLHCVVCCTNAKHHRSAFFADIKLNRTVGDVATRTGKHGNYMAVKYLHSAINYVKKDGDYIEHGQLLAANSKEKKPSVSIDIATMLGSGKSMVELNAEYPGFFLMNYKKILDYRNWLQYNSSTSKLPIAERFKAVNLVELNYGEQVVFNWLKKNVHDGDNRIVDRPLRQPQLWLWGPPGIGKTSFIQELDKYLSIFYPIYESEYLDGYEDNIYDIAIFDEFMGQKTITFLNSFIDGSHKRYNVKNAYTVKKQNIPVVFVSNYRPGEVYKHQEEKNNISLTALVDRLLVVEVTSLFNLVDQMRKVIEPLEIEEMPPPEPSLEL